MTLDHQFAIFHARFSACAARIQAAFHNAFGDYRRSWRASHRASRLDARAEALIAAPDRGDS